MFNITLYNFNKKINSISRPASGGQSFMCSIKDVNSILTPVIELTDTKGNNDIPLFNYAYIPAFKRYYFVDDISYSIGAWIIAMHVDVLATYQNDIINSTQYVLRSASESNSMIIDSLYTSYVEGDQYDHDVGNMTTNVTRYDSRDGDWKTVNYFDRTIDQGEIVLGIAGGSNYGVTYYAMPVGSFYEIVKNAMSLIPSDMNDVSSGIANAVFDPLQYVTYCKWFPMKPLPQNIGNTMVHSIKFGNYDVAFDTIDSFCYVFSGLATEKYQFNIELPAHPNEGSYRYLHFEPFSEYSLVFEPFGSIPIDTTKTAGADRLTVQWAIDFCTGQSIIDIYSPKVSEYCLIYTSMSEIGVTIPVSALIMDWKAGLTVSALNFLKSATGKSSLPKLDLFNKGEYKIDEVTGKKLYPASGNIDILDTMQDIIGSALGNVSTKGSAGSFLAYNYRRPFINAWFRRQAEHDNERFGSPLCKRFQLSKLSGFTLCANAVVNYVISDPTASEQLAVAEALNTGVYL